MDRRFEDEVEIIEIDEEEIEIIEIDDETSLKNLEICNKKINNNIINKIRKKLTNKKAAIVTVASLTLLITLTSIFVINKTLKQNTWKQQENIVYTNTFENIEFTLNNPEYNKVQINSEYEEQGAKIIIDGIDKSEEIQIDTNNLNTSKIGTYQIIYRYPINKNQIKTLYRTINIVDTEAPTIKILGEKIYTMLINETYIEPGILVSDNSKEDLTNKIQVENNIDTTRPGTYYVKYTVEDSSGNQTIAYRTVQVKYTHAQNTNSITYNKFTENGIYITGTVQNNNYTNKMLLKNKTTGNEIQIDTNKTSNHYYQLSLDVTNLENGTYEFYLINDELEHLTNNMNTYNRIVRAHIKDKLITMNYDKSKVNMTVEDFKYLYDVVIDPGHGGDDTGATNGAYIEKKINLEQSLYEKQRYEQHGLRVLLLRESNDNYGITLGESNWELVDQKGYAVGYYGAVSKIIYSNHHNSSGNETSRGWEILTPAQATYDDLKVEHQIADTWTNMYAKQINPYYRFYTKDFETGTPTNKLNGEVYDFDDYYSVIRIPNKLFNVKNVLYEGAYINNNSDMYWYYKEENWKKLSEVKIKEYVESIGVKYIAP